MSSTENYWEQEVHPEVMRISEREAWHRDAWDREQHELLNTTRRSDTPAYSPPSTEFVGEVWE